MGKRDEYGNRNTKKGKAKEKYDKGGKYNSRHIRELEALKENFFRSLSPDKIGKEDQKNQDQKTGEKG